ncbi:MAG: hypothetical protein J5507_03965 [Clostridia bacterium]|nr:hypothetical protein [Clostridia bacterium]
MNKLKRIKAILSILILIASIIFVIQPVLNAVSIGTRRSFDSFTYGLLNSTEFYCKDYGRSMYGGTWEAVSNVEFRSDSRNHNDRIRAYILYKGKESGQGGYNNYSKYQIALWMSYGANVTADHVGSQAKVNEGRNLYNEAYNATKNPIPFSGQSSTVIKTNSEKIKMDGNVGTIKLSQLTGTITSMVVELEEIGTKKVISKKINSGSNQVKDWIALYSNAEGTKPINVNSIKTNKVYIKNLNNNYLIKSVTINAKNDASKGYKVNATIWSNRGNVIGRHPSLMQQLLSVDAIQQGKPSQGSLNLKVEYATGNLKILKVDADHKDIVLSGAEFIIKKEGTENWIIPNSDGTYNYNGKYEDIVNNKVGVYTTNAKGIAEIKRLKYDTYHIYEIKAPDGYNIEKQDKYDKDKKWIDIGTVTLGGKDTNVTYTVTNKKIVSLEGRVWQDISKDKEKFVGDSVYKEDIDKLLAGIKVSLYNADNKVIVTTATDNQGYYKFENLNYWDLAGCYVGFSYDNINYVVVDPFVEKDIKINSKAIEETMIVEELEDSKLTGTNGDYPGIAITYKGGNKLTPKQILDNNKSQDKDLKTTPLTGYYNEETYTVEDINLGIVEKIKPEIYVGENLEYIKILMKGYTYTYKYGDTEVLNSQFVPTVEKQKNKHDFLAKLYPTDVAYNVENNTDELKVYAVYSVGVKNNTTTHIDDIYNEQKLYLSELKTAYDSNRFELSKAQIGSNQENQEFNLWNDSGDGVTFNINAEEKDGNVFANGIAENETKTTHIQFRLKDDIVRRILTDPDSIDNTKPATQVYGRGYHEYLRTDNVWVDNKDVIAFHGVKGTYEKTNTKGEKYYVHKSDDCEDISSALSLRFELGESRILSGIVFEDTVTKESKDNNTYLGNGILDDEEKNRAQEVTVELLDADKQTVTRLYQQDGNKVKYENGELPKAITKTTENGTYSFDGVVPGYYYIRFTYGDGSQKMVDVDGKEVDIKSKDYKSTIITNKTIQDAMEAKDQTEAMKLADWYKNQGVRNKSTAVDDLDQRKLIDGFVYNADGTVTDKDGNVKTDIMNINSYTPMIGISIEDDTDETSENNNGKQYNNEFTGFNLGLIKQPDTTIIVDKKITDVKFTNQVGTTLVSENPASRQSTYVTALDAIEGGSKYAKLEIEPEYIYGSNIELTYEISIKNNSAQNYVEDANDPDFGDYYKYGKSEKAEAKKITIRVLEDDLDEKFNYQSLPKTTTQKTSSNNHESNEIRLEPKTETIENSDGTTTTKQYIEMTGWESLESEESTKTSYTVTALIANDDLDSDYRNDAKVKSLSIDTLSTLNTKTMEEWGANDKTVFTITPTTGENRNQTYWYIGAIALALIASGLILIKKKVL